MDVRRLHQCPPSHRRSRGRHRAAGRPAAAFTLIEILLASFILLLMALMFAAVVPIAVRGTHMSRSYTQAVLLAQRKIDDCQSVGYGVLEQSTIPPTYKIVDPPGTPTILPNGFRRYEFTQTDQLGTVFKGAGGLAPVGYLELNQNAIGGAAIKGQPSLMSVTVRISWAEGANSKRSEYVISTLVTKMDMTK